MNIFRRKINNIMERMVDNMYRDIDIDKYRSEVELNRIFDIYEGNPHWLELNQKSTNMAANALAILSNKVTLELASEIVTKKKSNKGKLQLEKGYNHLIDNSRKYIEQLMVGGYGAYRVFFSKGRVGVEFVHAKNIVPLAFDDYGDLVEVLFLSKTKHKGKHYTKVEHHKFEEGGNYTVKTTVHKEGGIGYNGKLTEEVPKSTVPIWASTMPDHVVEKAKMPYYVYVKTPGSNFKDVESESGVSLITKAEKALDDYDYLNHLYRRAYKAGKVQVYVPEVYTKLNAGTEDSPAFQDEDFYVKLAGDPSMFNGNNMIDVKAPDINYDSYISGMDEHLRSIENSMGLAFGELSKSTDVSKTAEEIRTSRERSYSTVLDYQKIIKTTYEKLVEIMIYRLELLGVLEEPLGDYEVSFYFDDSIAMDRSYNQRLLAEYNAGLIRPEVYHMEVNGDTYEEAMDKVYGKGNWNAESTLAESNTKTAEQTEEAAAGDEQDKI